MEIGLSYDDVLLKPRYSPILSRKDVDLRSYLTKGIRLNIPIVASNMDTVCEADMAIAMALNGGMGIVHRFLTIEQQVEEVLKTKRYQSIKIESPYVVYQQQTLKEIKEVISQTGVTGFLVADHMDKLVGILSKRDMQFEDDDNKRVSELMTPREKLITASFSITVDEAKTLLKKHKIEKLPLINEDNKVMGLITSKDIIKKLKFPSASKDGKGRLLVGAAIGVKQDRVQRAIALAKAGVDVLVIDIAHGHSFMVLDTISEIRQYLGNVQLIAGNVATKEGALALIQAGADAVKVGVGPGSICTTRIVAGSG